jgi:lipid A 3-O-deacylase
MSDTLPVIYRARHRETAWSLSGQHSELTDLPLTAHCKENAQNEEIDEQNFKTHNARFYQFNHGYNENHSCVRIPTVCVRRGSTRSTTTCWHSSNPENMKTKRSLPSIYRKKGIRFNKRTPVKINEECRHNRQASERIGKNIVFILFVFGSFFATPSACAQIELTQTVTDPKSDQAVTFVPQPTSIWHGDVGEGFQPRTHEIGLELGANPSMATCGSMQAHGLALASLSYGRMIGEVKGEGHCYRGNWEILAELFGGAQFSPTTEWLVGLTPHLRYNFDTGTRLIPFIDGGLGPSATGIRRPDLSGTFEFNDQGNVGVRWFMRDKVALTAEVGYMHLSNAGIEHPNNGVNCVKGMVGVSWFF